MTPRDNSPADLDLEADLKALDDFISWSGGNTSWEDAGFAWDRVKARLQSAPRTGEAPEPDLDIAIAANASIMANLDKVRLKLAQVHSMAVQAAARGKDLDPGLVQKAVEYWKEDEAQPPPGAKEGPKPAEGETSENSNT